MKKYRALYAICSLVLSFCMLPIGADAASTRVLSEEDVCTLANSINIEQEYERAQAGISDIPVTKEMLSLNEAVLTDENGNEESLPVIGTVRKLGQVQRSNKLYNVYTITAFASSVKTDTDSETLHNTTAFGSITWIDNTGINNELVSVSGGWTTGGTDQLSGRSVEYGADNNDDKSAFYELGDGVNSFSYSGTDKMVGWVMYLDTYVNVNSKKLSFRVTGRMGF